MDTDFVRKDLEVGDWIVATKDSDYMHLVGVITAIEKIGSPEHGTDNDTDDVHVDFTAFNYPQVFVTEIEERFSGHYDVPVQFAEIPLDDVIMAPDMLVCISHIMDSGINIEDSCTLSGYKAFTTELSLIAS
jgi:hypothetical protein